ncbi:MAG: hypothetical protein IKQ30_05270 [Bacteroidales bacterium]|nr:hypothetical protein [Bacteroidales bacterium]
MLIVIILLIISVSTAAAQDFSVIKGRENQNVGLCEYDLSTNTVNFAPYIDSVNTCGVWFNFGVTGYRKDTLLTFKTDFNSEVHCPFYPAVSSDNVHFQRVRQKGFLNHFNLKINPTADTLYIATGFPYNYSRLNSLLDEINGSKNLTTENLITTDNGLNVKLLTISKNPNSKRAKLVWIICRQHAFESVSNYVMEGMIRYLLSDSCSRKLLKTHIFKIVPMVDVESVYNGQSGRMSLPKDFNRDWDNPVRKTILSIKQAIDSTTQNNWYSIFWDVHGMFPGGFVGCSFSYYDLYGVGKKHTDLQNYWRRFARLTKMKPIPIRDFQNGYDGLTADWWNELQHGSTLRFSSTIEVDWNLNHKGVPYSIEDYLEIGRMMIKSLE